MTSAKPKRKGAGNGKVFDDAIGIKLSNVPRIDELNPTMVAHRLVDTWVARVAEIIVPHKLSDKCIRRFKDDIAVELWRERLQRRRK